MFIDTLRVLGNSGEDGTYGRLGWEPILVGGTFSNVNLKTDHSLRTNLEIYNLVEIKIFDCG